MKKITGLIIFVFILTTFVIPAVTFADIIVAPPDRLPPVEGDTSVTPPDRLPPEDGGDTILPPIDALPGDNGAPNPEPTPIISPASGVCIDPVTTSPQSPTTRASCEAAGFTWEGSSSSSREEPGLVQCGRDVIYLDPKTNNEVPEGTPGAVKIADPKDSCDFDDVMYLINNIINWILLGLALPIAGIMFAYAGFTLITSGGSSGARTKAKEIFFSAAVGLVLAFTAYLIIVFFLKALGYDGSWIFSMF